MNKKHKKVAFVSFLVACAGVYSGYASRDDDPRAKEFADYISANIDSVVASHLTEEEIQEYAESYREHPESFELWVQQLVENSKVYNRKLVKEANVIHKLDVAAGRKLSFAEALRRIETMPDISGNLSDEIVLQREIIGKKGMDVDIALSRAAMERVKSEK